MLEYVVRRLGVGVISDLGFTTRHLNILGVYLQNCRFDMESKGPILDRSHGSKWQRINLCEKACGIKSSPSAVFPLKSVLSPVYGIQCAL